MPKTQSDLNIKNLFKELYVFGDSLNDYGSYAAYVQKTLLAPTALPAWSGVTFSNGNPVSQLDLRIRLGLTPPSVPAPNPALPDPYYLLANPYVASPGLGTEGAPSFAIGGASSGTESVYDVLEVPDPSTGSEVPLATLLPELANTGVQNQIRAAVAQGVKPSSKQLTLLQGGANDLLIAEILENPDITGVMEQVMTNMRENLTVALRSMGCRQLLTFALADFQGVVDGVSYQMPFLTGLLDEASAADAPAWLEPWKAFVDGGGLQKFQRNYKQAVADIARQFPYAAVIDYSPEFGTNWKLYGNKLGNFSSYGISNTVSYAQNGNEPLSTSETDSFLYFDTIHNTSSGQAMTAKAMALTLKANAATIQSAQLDARKVGNDRPNVLKAGRADTELIGRGADDLLSGQSGNDALSGDSGSDRIRGSAGNDWIRGGRNSDVLTGGEGADFYSYQREDCRAAWRDLITDFDGQAGDRLGLTAILDGKNPFKNPGWTFIKAEPFSGSGPELRFQNGWLLGDADGNAEADLRIRLEGVTSFDPNWIS